MHIKCTTVPCINLSPTLLLLLKSHLAPLFSEIRTVKIKKDEQRMKTKFRKSQNSSENPSSLLRGDTGGSKVKPDLTTSCRRG